MSIEGGWRLNVYIIDEFTLRLCYIDRWYNVGE